MGQNPFLFVVGCPRSGTTLLQRMLDNHPDLTVANDTHFIPKAIEGLEGGDPPLTPELFKRVVEYRRFQRLGLPPAAVQEAAGRASTYREFVAALYSELGRMQGKPLAGEKTPDYVRCLPLLHTLFPWAKVVHIIRDGRDVALSTLEWAREDKGPGRLKLWREEPVAVCALWWRWLVTTGQADAKRLGAGVYREVRYEDLVARPEESLRGIAGFLGVPFAREMIEYHVGKFRDEPGLDAKKAWAPPTPGLRDWRAKMAAQDVALFEAIAGDLLGAMGYERRTDAVSPEIADVAQRCIDWWMARTEGKRAKNEASEISDALSPTESA